MRELFGKIPFFGKEKKTNTNGKTESEEKGKEKTKKNEKEIAAEKIEQAKKEFSKQIEEVCRSVDRDILAKELGVESVIDTFLAAQKEFTRVNKILKEGRYSSPEEYEKIKKLYGESDRPGDIARDFISRNELASQLRPFMNFDRFTGIEFNIALAIDEKTGQFSKPTNSFKDSYSTKDAPFEADTRWLGFSIKGDIEMEMHKPNEHLSLKVDTIYEAHHQGEITDFSTCKFTHQTTKKGLEKPLYQSKPHAWKDDLRVTTDTFNTSRNLNRKMTCVHVDYDLAIAITEEREGFPEGNTWEKTKHIDLSYEHPGVTGVFNLSKGDPIGFGTSKDWGRFHKKQLIYKYDDPIDSANKETLIGAHDSPNIANLTPDGSLVIKEGPHGDRIIFEIPASINLSDIPKKMKDFWTKKEQPIPPSHQLEGKK